VIVVATEDFELYHELVTELRDRDLEFTTIEPGEELPAKTSVVLTGDGEREAVDDPLDVPIIEAEPADPRSAVEEAIGELSGDVGRTVVGIDPGEYPGIAVLKGDRVVATYQVEPDAVAEIVHDEIEEAEDPLVRIGDGARLIGARIIDAVDAPVELVDETGTTPFVGAGTSGLGDVIAAINIARMEGERVDTRDVEPTSGELQRIQERSRRESNHNRTIDADLAERVATGELTISEALEQHKENE
jgi:hypothetical protein